jgi:hypothetical protein
MPSSIENGFASSTCELLWGYPGYFYVPEDGEYIMGLDRRYGLPIRSAGDAGPDSDWICGFNRGVIAHVERYGIPWNSRLSSLDLLSDMPSYFDRLATEITQLGRTGGVAFTSEGLGVALSLEDGPMGASVKLRGQSLFHNPGVVFSSMAAYRTGLPTAATPTAPCSPPLGNGQALIPLRFFNSAQCIKCVSGPVGSCLVIFRFSEFEKHWPRDQRPVVFAALDIQLADWIPATGRFSSYDPTHLCSRQSEETLNL